MIVVQSCAGAHSALYPDGDRLHGLSRPLSRVTTKTPVSVCKNLHGWAAWSYRDEFANRDTRTYSAYFRSSEAVCAYSNSYSV